MKSKGVYPHLTRAFFVFLLCCHPSLQLSSPAYRRSTRLELRPGLGYKLLGNGVRKYGTVPKGVTFGGTLSDIAGGSSHQRFHGRSRLHSERPCRAAECYMIRLILTLFIAIYRSTHSHRYKTTMQAMEVMAPLK